MPTYGKYEAAQRLHLTGVGALYALKSDDARVVKVLQPKEGIWSEDLVREEIDGFLLRAKTQKILGKASKNWAPVHETSAIRAGSEAPSGGGEDVSKAETLEYRASGAYCILDRYERSVQSLIEGRVRITNDDLRNIVAGTIRGLIDIRTALQRPHGDLKPTNILLHQSADLANAAVLLTDPAPDGAISANSANQDLADLAKIIYQLVNLRPFQGGTIGRAREWDRLGPNGEDWRKLCGAWLDAGAPAEERDLEKTLARVVTWTLKPKKNKTPMLIAAAALFLIIGGSITAFILTRPPKLDFNPQNWEKLCFSYYAWFGDFSDHFADNTARQKYSAANYPSQVVALLTAAGSDLDKYQPRKLAKKPESAKELAMEPTEDAKTGYAPYYTKMGVQLVDAVSNALTPENWPLLQTLDTTASTYEKRGWLKPAAGIRGLITSARPPPLPEKPLDIVERAKLVQSVDMFANIDKTIQAAQTVTRIDGDWARIEDQLKRLPTANGAREVPLLSVLPQFAEDFPRSTLDPSQPATLADVQALAASFTQIDQLLTQLVTELNQSGREIVYSELAGDPAAQLPADGAPTLSSFRALPELAKNYVKIKDDPRLAIDWKKTIDDVQKDFIDIINVRNATDAHLPKLKQDHGDFISDINSFAGIAPVEKNRHEIEVRVAKARDDREALLKEGATWVAPYLKKPAEVIAEQQARLNTSVLAHATPVVAAQWQGKHKALLEKLRTATRGVDIMDWNVYLDFTSKFDLLEQTYINFDKAIPTAISGLSDVPGSAWQHMVAAHVATIWREDALKDIMTNPALKWTGDKPQVDDPAYLSYQKQRLDIFAQVCTDTRTLIADFSTLTDRLDHLHLLPDEPARGAATWRELFAKWQNAKSPLLADSVIAAALKPLVDRVNALLALDSVTSYPTLVADASAPAPEIALTAWRKLGSVPVAENLPVLADEDKAESALTAQLTDLSKTTPPHIDAAQLAAFTREIQAARPLRWRRWADTLSSAAAVQTALDRRASFNVTFNPQTDAALIYNDALYALRKDFEPPPPTVAPTEAQLKVRAQAFIDAVNRMPPAVSGDKSIQDLLARMAKPLQQTEVESSAAGAGPKLAGWEQDNSNPDLRLFYYPSKSAPKYTLEFVKLQVNNKTIFLCTTEMSFALFADTVNASGKFADLDNVGKPSAKAHWFKTTDDPYEGPRTWKITDHKFTLNPTWLFKVPQMGDNPYYPPNADLGHPAADSPMQYVSPWSALYVSRLLGCRLPTSAEWKAAYDKFEIPSSQKDAWNLRGSAWKLQQDYAQKLSSNGMQFPDQGIFFTPDLLFADINATKARPWTGDALAKIAPTRFTPGADPYRGSAMWFRKVGAQPGSSPPGSSTAGNPLHDLVGNVAEYTFDAPTAITVIKDNVASAAAIDEAITANKKTLFIIGGSSLSPPEIPFNERQNLDPDFAQTSTGFADVGFRLAYTAPIDSIVDVLASVFKDPKYLPIKSGQ